MSLPNNLACEMCHRPMLSPIYLCMNGHIICRSCKSCRNTKCSICNGVISDTRNRFAEFLSYKMLVPCRFKPHGCPELRHETEMGRHESLCGFKQVECRAGKNTVKCGWSGSKSELVNHVEFSPDETFYWQPHPIADPVYQGLRLDRSYRETDLVYMDCQLFWLYIKYDADTGDLMEAVQCLADKETANKYTAEHSLKFEGGSQKLIHINTTLCETDDVEQAFRDGRCFVLDQCLLDRYFVPSKFTVKGYCFNIIKRC